MWHNLNAFVAVLTEQTSHVCLSYVRVPCYETDRHVTVTTNSVKHFARFCSRNDFFHNFRVPRLEAIIDHSRLTRRRWQRTNDPVPIGEPAYFHSRYREVVGKGPSISHSLPRTMFSTVRTPPHRTTRYRAQWILSDFFVCLPCETCTASRFSRDCSLFDVTAHDSWSQRRPASNA